MGFTLDKEGHCDRSSCPTCRGSRSTSRARSPGGEDEYDDGDDDGRYSQADIRMEV